MRNEWKKNYGPVEVLLTEGEEEGEVGETLEKPRKLLEEPTVVGTPDRSGKKVR